MDNSKDSDKRSRYKKFLARIKLKNIELIKERNKEGQITGYIVSVNKGGYYTRQRFNNIKKAFAYIKSLDLEDDPFKDRRHDRIRSVNIISFDCINEKGKLVKRGIGRTLNVSQGGILLETYIPVDPKYTLLLTIDMEDDLVTDIEAEIIYCKPGKDGKYESGLKFRSTSEVIKGVVNKHIETLKDNIGSVETE